MNPNTIRNSSPQRKLLLTLLPVLYCIGIICTAALRGIGGEDFYIVLIFSVVGVLFSLFVSRIGWRTIRGYSHYLMGTALLLVLINDLFGNTWADGAKEWLSLGFASFYIPSLVTVISIPFFASLLATSKAANESFGKMLLRLVPSLLVISLLLAFGRIYWCIAALFCLAAAFALSYSMRKGCGFVTGFLGILAAFAYMALKSGIYPLTLTNITYIAPRPENTPLILAAFFVSSFAMITMAVRASVLANRTAAPFRKTILLGVTFFLTADFLLGAADLFRASGIFLFPKYLFADCSLQFLAQLILMGVVLSAERTYETRLSENGESDVEERCGFLHFSTVENSMASGRSVHETVSVYFPKHDPSRELCDSFMPENPENCEAYLLYDTIEMNDPKRFDMLKALDPTLLYRIRYTEADLRYFYKALVLDYDTSPMWKLYGELHIEAAEAQESPEAECSEQRA